MWTVRPMILIFRLHKGIVSIHLPAWFGPNQLSGCWEMGYKKESTQLRTALFKIWDSYSTVSTHLRANFRQNWLSSCKEKVIWNIRDGCTDRCTICFYSIECIICDKSSWYFVFIKPLAVPTFLPGMVYISQVVAEKWATETLEKKTKSFSYYIKSGPCDQSSRFPGFIKALTVPTFLPGLVQISQAVAEKRAPEWKIETYRQLFLYNDPSDWSSWFLRFILWNGISSHAPTSMKAAQRLLRKRRSKWDTQTNWHFQSKESNLVPH